MRRAVLQPSIWTIYLSIQLHGRSEYLVPTAPIPSHPAPGDWAVPICRTPQDGLFITGCLPSALHISATHGSWAKDCKPPTPSQAVSATGRLQLLMNLTGLWLPGPETSKAATKVFNPARPGVAIDYSTVAVHRGVSEVLAPLPVALVALAALLQPPAHQPTSPPGSLGWSGRRFQVVWSTWLGSVQ